MQRLLRALGLNGRLLTWRNTANPLGGSGGRIGYDATMALGAAPKSESARIRLPSESVSARMRSVKVRHTAPELAVRRLLHALGVRFRVRPTNLPGRPDITNVGKRWCIFVHGCYWHGHSCWRGRLPKVNVAFWRKKISSNKERDKFKIKALRHQGFRVLVVWQCELDNAPVLQHRLARFVGARNLK
jgi:DNA mismatch endonuclease, patch repair protein